MTLTSLPQNIANPQLKLKPVGGVEFDFRLLSQGDYAAANRIELDSQLELTSAFFVFGMFFIVAFLGIIAQESILVFLAGISVAILVPIFAFLSLYINCHKLQ